MLKLYIIDDSAQFRKSFKRLLGSLPHTTVIGEAASVRDAVAFIESNHPDCILLDVELPDGNGFNVLEQIRSSSYKPEVLMITNYPAPPFREMAQHYGVVHFYDKTTEFESAIETLRTLSVTPL